MYKLSQVLLLFPSLCSRFEDEFMELYLGAAQELVLNRKFQILSWVVLTTILWPNCIFLTELSHRRFDCGWLIPAFTDIRISWKKECKLKDSNRQIVLYKRRSVSNKQTVCLTDVRSDSPSDTHFLCTCGTAIQRGVDSLGTLAAALTPCIKWSNDILQTHCFAGPPCSCWLTGGPYVITALRPPKIDQNMHTDVLFLTSFPPCVRFPAPLGEASLTPASPRMLGPQMRARNH